MKAPKKPVKKATPEPKGDAKKPKLKPLSSKDSKNWKNKLDDDDDDDLDMNFDEMDDFDANLDDDDDDNY